MISKNEQIQNRLYFDFTLGTINIIKTNQNKIIIVCKKNNEDYDQVLILDNTNFLFFVIDRFFLLTKHLNNNNKEILNMFFEEFAFDNSYYNLQLKVVFTNNQINKMFLNFDDAAKHAKEVCGEIKFFNISDMPKTDYEEIIKDFDKFYDRLIKLVTNQR